MAAMQPVLDLIRADPAAAEAAGKLRKLDQVWISEHMSRAMNNPNAGPVPFMVGQGTDVFIPPYDHAKIALVTLQDQPPIADPQTGTLECRGTPDDTYDGSYKVIAGVAVDLKVTTAGTLEVTPMVTPEILPEETDNVSWWASAGGYSLDAGVEGHVTATVADNGRIPDNPNTIDDYEHFSYYSNPGWLSNDDQGGKGIGPTLSEQLSVSISAVPGHTYQVWFNLVINGDQSGTEYAGGFSMSSGVIRVRIPFFVTSLTQPPNL